MIPEAYMTFIAVVVFVGLVGVIMIIAWDHSMQLDRIETKLDRLLKDKEDNQ